MDWLVLGLVLFLGIHSVSIAAPRWRHAVAHRIGEGPWKGLYTLVALAGFALPPLAGRIGFDNVVFRYRADGPEVLRNVTLEIQPGEVIGVVDVEDGTSR